MIFVSMAALALTTVIQPSSLNPITTHAVKVDLPVATGPEPQMPLPVPAPPPPLPNPSAAARRLVLQLIAPAVDVMSPPLRQEIRLSLFYASHQAACDPHNAQCDRIAAEIATREAPVAAAQLQDVIGRVIGDHLDRTMTVAQIEEASRFADSDAGRALLGSLLRLNEIDIRQTQRLVPRSLVSDTVRAEFLARTRDLPRQPRGAAIPFRVVPAAPPLAPPRP